MKLNDLMRMVQKILPDAQFEEDNDGQIVIYTDLEETPNGTIRKFEAPEDENVCPVCGLKQCIDMHQW